MIKKMKRNLTGVLLTALMMGACNHAPQEGTYHLRGMVTNPKLEGRTIYLQDAVKNAAVGTLRYDSTTVSEGRFVFNGKVTVPQVRELFIQETDSDYFPVTLPHKISIEICWSKFLINFGLIERMEPDSHLKVTHLAYMYPLCNTYLLNE